MFVGIDVVSVSVKIGNANACEGKQRCAIEILIIGVIGNDKANVRQYGEPDWTW